MCTHSTGECGPISCSLTCVILRDLKKLVGRGRLLTGEAASSGDTKDITKNEWLQWLPSTEYKIMCYEQANFISITTHGVGTFLVMWTLMHKDFKWLARHSGCCRTRIQHLSLGKMPCFRFPFVPPQVQHRALTCKAERAVELLLFLVWLLVALRVS